MSVILSVADLSKTYASGFEALKRVKEPRTSGVSGREGKHWKSRPDDPRWPVQHFGGREGFGVDCGRFL